MNKHNATEQAYKHGYEKGRADAIDLINRQQAEIERLELQNVAQSYKEIPVSMARIYKIGCESAIVKRIEAEAVKEFAEQIKKHCTSIELNEYIDTLVQEMRDKE